MNHTTWDYPLFEALNFEGGAMLDWLMSAISGTVMWIPLYLLILYMVWRRWSWRGVVALLVAVGLALGLADLLAGIFKHSGPLKNLLPDFPARLRPMFSEGLSDVNIPSTNHGRYGTVSAHAATIVSLSIVSAYAIHRRWFSWLITVVAIVICYSRIYLACHFPQDILLGAALGIITATLGILVFRAIAGKDKRW
ncbi:MAG: phosphatase PAP2 family protein [Alistipes sp.]|nr:phosphatase PAP2 family protein [Alistipes sp.]MBQ8775462.1 phosphatase PAP2 family protein [Alistipes sp.]